MLYFLIISLFLNLVVCEYPPFSQYVVSFNKNYSEDEYNRRENIYNERIANFSTITDYIPGISNITDWTNQQIQALLAYKRTPEQQRLSSAHSLGSRRLGNPSSLDWRANKYITRVKDQGNCGSCWAFASVALVQSFLIKYRQQDNTIDLSEQKVLQCSGGDSNCGGGYLIPALQGISKYAPLQSDYPYTGQNYIGGYICNEEGVQTNFQVSSYFTVSDSELIDLLQQGPVQVALSADGWQYYGSGVLSCSSSAQVNHAVLAVGYTTTSIIIKNSWGTSWGMNGYAYISRSSARNCKIGDQAYTLSWQSNSVIYLIGILFLVSLL